MTKFNQCPNCGRKATEGILITGWFNVFECKKCKSCYCDDGRCGNGRCPNCGSKERSKAGECWPRK